MQQSPGAMQLRVLQSVDGLGTSASNTVVLFPVEWVHIVRELERLWRREAQPPEDMA